MEQQGRLQSPPRKTPMDLEDREKRVIQQLRSLIDFGWGDLTVQVRNNGEIVMIKKETHDLVAQQRRRD